MQKGREMEIAENENKNEFKWKGIFKQKHQYSCKYLMILFSLIT